MCILFHIYIIQSNTLGISLLRFFLTLSKNSIRLWEKNKNKKERGSLLKKFSALSDIYNLIFSAVKTEGTGSSLLPPVVKESLKRCSSDHSIDDRDFCCQSNEALASPCETVNNSDQDEEELLLDSETEMAAGDVKYEKLDADEEMKVVDSSFAQSKKTGVKPPNITVYCGKEDSKESFDRIRSVLEQCVDNERYVIYQVVHSEMSTVPWSDNTELLVLASEESCKDVDEAVLTYLERGGKIISFGCCVDNLFLKMEALGSSGSMVQMSCHKWSNIVVKSGGLAYTDIVKMPEYNCSVLAEECASKKPLIVKLHSIFAANPEPSLAILSQVSLLFIYVKIGSSLLLILTCISFHLFQFSCSLL